MDYFKVAKHQLIEDNVAYTAMYLYNLLDKKMYLDEILQLYVESKRIQLSFGVEKTLLLSLTFLFGIGKINIIDGMIERC